MSEELETNVVTDARRLPFYQIDNHIIDEYGAQMKPIGIAVYNVLCKYANKSGENAFPKMETIGNLIGVGRDTVGKSINNLKSLGLISVEERTIKGKTASNLYTILNAKRNHVGKSNTAPANRVEKSNVEKSNVEKSNVEKSNTNKNQVFDQDPVVDQDLGNEQDPNNQPPPPIGTGDQVSTEPQENGGGGGGDDFIFSLYEKNFGKQKPAIQEQLQELVEGYGFDEVKSAITETAIGDNVKFPFRYMCKILKRERKDWEDQERRKEQIEELTNNSSSVSEAIQQGGALAAQEPPAPFGVIAESWDLGTLDFEISEDGVVVAGPFIEMAENRLDRRIRRAVAHHFGREGVSVEYRAEVSA